MAAVVERGGGCGFAEKAIVAQKLGATALVVLNTDDGLIKIGADPELGLAIPTIMITQQAKDDLKRLLRDTGCSPSGDVLLRVRYDAIAVDPPPAPPVPEGDEAGEAPAD